ncbi:OmpA family protein [Aquimarina sp. ERC-38]|uniref:OmpA family protein n=1 Tax=Aquimarina sp. ERC-38 TaxID=2949996 RepID=UPI002245FC9D|nr:OmpA family protein [Aquimarina sp. ERC-38]UZO80863.1 OmpA family protein [Aquimarina sp. ERC-38]
MKIPKFSLLLFINCVLFIKINSIYSQNLIPNPSFEETNVAVKKLTHQMRNFGIMSDWKALTNSPDAYHPFLAEVDFAHKAPKFLNQFGPQEPRTGEGKVGFFVAGNASKEGIIAPLTAPLKAGTYYYFHMYVSLSEGISNSCTSSIGPYFTAIVPRITETSKFNLHITSPELLCDTQGWTKVCGVYKAKGTEKYVSIGYFSNSPKGKGIKGGDFRDAYYFVDDLELRELQKVENLVEDDICNMALDFKDIDYLIGETEVYEEIKTALDSYLQYMKIFKIDSIKIIGHANDTSIDFENEIIADTRADYVREYLIENGIDETIIEAVGVANTEPKELEEGELEEPGSNARVQIIIE